MLDREEINAQLQRMMVMKFRVSAVCVSLLVAGGVHAANKAKPVPTKADQPNIIIVMTDDQGYGDLSFTGNSLIKTPHIDQIGQQGAWLKNFYVSPVCTPTRAALMTGRYPQRTRAYDTYIGHAMMDPEEVTIAELLKQEGYRTGIFGKWHLGDCYPMRPSDQGFDESLIHLGGGLAQPSDPIENNKRYTDPILFHNNEEKPYQGYCTDLFFDAAMDWMEQSVKAEKPFFAYISLNAPHGPFHDVPEKNYQHFKGKTKDDKTARVFAMIENIDENMGRLLERLEKNDTRGNKIADNTLLIFLTDNGPNSMRYVGPFRGMKGHVNEGGIRTSFLARWPARIPVKHSNTTTAAHIDMLPTLLAAAGVKTPGSLAVDGVNVLPLLTGETPPNWNHHRALVLQWHRGIPEKGRQFALIDGPWKLLSSQRKGRGKQVPGLQLYHTLNDPGEKKNLAKKRPEKVLELKAKYDAWFASMQSTRPDPFASPRIVLGTQHETLTRFSKQDWQRESGEVWGNQGHWLVQAAKPGRYTAKLILDKPSPEPIPVTLNIAGKSYSTTLPAKATEHLIEGISIAVGDWKIRAQSEGDTPVAGFYQLILELVD